MNRLDLGAFSRETHAALVTRERDRERARVPPSLLPAIPGLEAFEEIVEVVFLASMFQEESHLTETALVWALECNTAGLIPLMAPMEASPAAIAKLAPAADRERAPLAIRSNDGNLQVWGLINQGPIPPPNVVVRALAPGIVRVDYGAEQIALYARGQKYLARPEAPSPHKILTDAFANWRADAMANGRNVSARAAVVTSLASRGMALGHGGMVLVVPPHEDPVDVSMGNRIEPSAASLRDAFARLEQSPSGGVNTITHIIRPMMTASAGVLVDDTPEKRRFGDALDFSAHLTAVDGAIVIDPT